MAQKRISDLNPATIPLSGDELIPLVQSGATVAALASQISHPTGEAGGSLSGSYPSPSIADSGVVSGVYGTEISVPIIDIMADGRIANVVEVPIAFTPASTVLPSNPGTRAIGTSNQYAKADHVHSLQSISLSGAISGSGTTSISTSLSTTGVTAATYGSTTQSAVIAVGADGRVTSATNQNIALPVASNIVPSDAGTAAIGNSPQYAKADHIHNAQVITLSGDVTGSGSSAITATLPASGASAGTYGGNNSIPVVSVNSKGLVTSVTAVPVSGSAGGTVTSVTAGDGLIGGTITSSGTIELPVITGLPTTPIGSTTSVPIVSVDDKGRITSLTSATISSGRVITANDANPGLLITQTGTGNALVVEDSTNPDATPFVVDASGNVGIGTNSPGAKLDIGGEDGTQIYLRSTGTVAAKIRSYVNETESAVIGFLNGGGQYFETAGTERLRIIASGNVGIGTTSPAQKLDVAGVTKSTSFIETVVSYTSATPFNYNISLNNGTTFIFQLPSFSGASQVNLPVPSSGQSFVVFVKQPSSGLVGSIIFAENAPKWINGTTPTLTATLGKTDIFSFVTDGTSWYGTYVQNF